MKLRNFLYINEKLLNEYLSAIDGGLYDEEFHTTNTSNKKTSEVKGDIKLIKGQVINDNQSVEGVKKHLIINTAAKFERLFNFLKKEKEVSLQEVDSIDTDTFNKLKRDDFLEALINIRFSKTKEYIQTLNQIEGFLPHINSLLGTKQLTQEIDLPSILKETLLLINKGLLTNKSAFVGTFEDNSCHLYGYFNNEYLTNESDVTIGEVYLFCKIQKKINSNQKIIVDKLFSHTQYIPDIINPDTINFQDSIDEIDGPALRVIPIAIYQ